MKISNLIILAFAVIVIGSLLVLFIDSKYHNENENSNFEKKTYPLADFSVVVAEKEANIQLDYGQKNEIDVEYQKNEIPEKLNLKIYKLCNDTLYIYGGLRTFVKSNNLKSIIAQKTRWFGLGQFKYDSLKVDVVSGNIMLDADIKKLVLIVSDSAYVRTLNHKVENLNLFAKGKSNIELNGNYKTVNARIYEKKNISFEGSPASLKFQRDSTSTITIWN